VRRGRGWGASESELVRGGVAVVVIAVPIVGAGS
jgi:hypothetical protein